MKKIIITGATKGIGRSIAKFFLTDNKFDVHAFSSKDFDSSSLVSVNSLIKLHSNTDVLIMNTGGPPNINFYDITLDDWNKYHNQLFLNFAILLQKIKIKKNGYLFLISSGHIKEPNNQLILSSVYRTALSSLLKSYAIENFKKKISCINIMPLAIKTNRIKKLVGKNLKKFENDLPFGSLGDPDDIGKFIYSIVSNDIKYLNGISISFDGGLSKSLF